MRSRALLFAVSLVAVGLAACGELRRTLSLRAEAGSDGVTADHPIAPGGDAGDVGSEGGADDHPVAPGGDAARDVPADGTAGDRGAPPDGGDNGSAANGTRCQTGGECTSGLCVDGFCCNALCDGQCEACDVATLEGVCAPVPAGRPHGARSACGGTGACAGQCGGTVRGACAYPGPATTCRAQTCTGNTKTRPAGCDGTGACAPVQMVTCPQGCSGNDCLGSCAGDNECIAAGQGRPYCDGGTCTTLKPNGRACTTGTDCTSGWCADGYCCNIACSGQCTSCKELGSLGTCVPVVGDPRVGGAPARSGCTGTGVCRGQCDGLAATCQFPTSSTSCGTASCAGGSLTPVGGCNSAGACAQMGIPCPTNFCSSNTACGACPNDAACGSGNWCDAGTCRAKQANGTACAVAAQCTSGNCETNPGATGGVCCSADCTGTTPRCNAAGTACICAGTSCGGGDVCFQDACCTPDSCAGCHTFTCQPGCGRPAVQPTCIGGAVCCNGFCCSGNCCEGTTCTSNLCP